MGLFKYIEKLENLIRRWPGEKWFGPYRFLPFFFFGGAALEFCMIHWRPNGINFYDTYKEKKSHEKAALKLQKWKEIEASSSFLTSLLGSSVVHSYYQPLADFDELVNLEFDELMKAYVEEKDQK